MATLASELRNKLERVVVDARDAAEAGARAALEAMAVHHHEPYPHMKPTQRKLRNHLRARARQLGDKQDARDRLAINHLVGECAYEHWHRMLFARFLAENSLLIEPQENMAISLDEAEELAKEEGVNVWVFASRCAQRMLPQIFRPDDPLLQVSFATEHMLKLEKLLDSLPPTVFTASDALGWVYQFWQSKKKDEVNRSEVKIGADELPAVTQLFTEPYMVSFLIHNTLGAWHAGKVLPALSAEALAKADEASLRKACALPGVGWEYLRFVRGVDGKGGPWRPAAGTFDGWPKTAAEIKVLDPCCGSGHFLVAALHHLAPIRMAEEGLSATEAVDAVLRDNLHGLEIDERCCQIAAFALAFAAWTYPDAGGYRPLPELHIACTGIGPQATEEQWIELAVQSGIRTSAVAREPIRNGLLNLHELFSQAPTLGSLINPSELPGDLIAADYETIQPYLADILKAEKADDETHERAVAAAGMVKAADLLTGEYTLVITNVPYLGRGKQDDLLKAHLERHYKEGKADLATACFQRCLESCEKNATVALVVPQACLYLSSFSKLRQSLLETRTWNLIARLGPGAFETISGHVVNVALVAISATRPTSTTQMTAIDVSAAARAAEKAEMLSKSGSERITLLKQVGQLRNPGCGISFEVLRGDVRIGDIAYVGYGSKPGQTARVTRYIWEFGRIDSEHWTMMVSTPDGISDWSGRAEVCLSLAQIEEQGITEFGVRGADAWGKHGVIYSKMTHLPASLYDGEFFDDNTNVVVPNRVQDLPAFYAYMKSGEFNQDLRRVNRKLNVTRELVEQFPFDLAHWQKVAAEKHPKGLPEPESDDPTQWLFHGRPEESTAPLRVAVARLLGYRWPAELDGKMRLSKRARELVEQCDELLRFADKDGIVCIPPVRGEEPAAEQLLALLAACGIKPAKVRELAGGVDLDDWLRNSFFQEHCELFHHRPFVWHIWDGRKRDGFHALVNYHKLCGVEAASSRLSETRQDAESIPAAGSRSHPGRKLLESLTYSYLGDWIARQKDGVQRGEGGAEDRLAAALELQKRLEAILAGEPPFDIFVRWKTLSQQSIGWEPDINDGVRMNIRPFLASDLPNGRTGAGILRWKPNIKWTKDRGKEPERPKKDYPWFWGFDPKNTNHKTDFMGGKEFDGNRWNECHYTNKAKQATREEAGKGDT